MKFFQLESIQFQDICKGIEPTALVNLFVETTSKETSAYAARKILATALHNAKKSPKKNIWKERCSRIKEWEEGRGININQPKGETLVAVQRPEIIVQRRRVRPRPGSLENIETGKRERLGNVVLQKGKRRDGSEMWPFW